MLSYNAKLQKLSDLWKMFLDFSQDYFWWQDTFIHKDGDSYLLSTEGDTSIWRLYFARNNPHTDFSFWDKLSIWYFSPNHFKIQGFHDLDEIYSEYDNIFTKVKDYHEKASKEEIEREKQELRESLEFQLSKLK